VEIWIDGTAVAQARTPVDPVIYTPHSKKLASIAEVDGYKMDLFGEPEEHDDQIDWRCVSMHDFMTLSSDPARIVRTPRILTKQ